MNSILRAAAVIAVILAVVTLATRRTPAQGKALSPHQRLGAKAKAAHQGDPQAVREFTDEIFNQHTPFAKAAESLKERVSRCESLFRQGLHDPIDEKHFEKTFNDHVRDFGAPSFWKINESQIKTLRGHRRQLIPGFVEPRASNRNQLSEQMGPAETAYILMQMAMNKHFNQEFQVEPQEWDHRAQARKKTGLPKKSSLVTVASGEIQAGGQPFTNPSAQLESDIQKEHSELTASTHRLLDRLGFQR